MNISVGINVSGFKEKRITDEELLKCKASKILIYLDKESNDRLMDYYKAIRTILRQGDNKLLVLINDDDKPNIVQPITHLCLEYGCYRIYKVVQETVIDEEYVLDMFKRESSQDEVQLFISNEDEAYETITEAMLHITEYCLDNKLDDLQDYIIQNKDLIRQYPLVLDYMKQNIDELNLGIGKKVKSLEKELKRIQDDKKEVENSKAALEKNILNLENVVSQHEEDTKKYRHKIESYEETLKKLQMEKEDLEKRAKQLQSSAQAVTGGTLKFTNYSPIKITQIKGNKLKTIIYFKEITRPKYINTMVIQFLEYLNTKLLVTKNKTKLVIYDNREDFNILYNPLEQANTSNYFEKRMNLLNNNIIVFTDTNPAYLDDLSTKSGAEYLIIYDRLGQNSDLLIGDAVVKFYTFASKKDLINYKSKFTDLDESKVIMNPSGVNNTLELSELDGFNGTLSKAAQFAKYFKMKANKNTGATFFDIILGKCGLPTK